MFHQILVTCVNFDLVGRWRDTGAGLEVRGTLGINAALAGVRCVVGEALAHAVVLRALRQCSEARSAVGGVALARDALGDAALASEALQAAGLEIAVEVGLAIAVPLGLVLVVSARVRGRLELGAGRRCES